MDLDRAVLKEALLASADLRQAQMGASYLKCASLEKADLRGTMLKGACLEEAYVREAKMNEDTLVMMEGASLRGAVFDSEQVELARNIGLTDLDIRSGGSYEQNSRIERKEKESLISFGRLIRIGRKREDNLTEKNDDSKMDDARRRILNGETRGIPFGRYRQDKMIGELYVPTPLLWRVLKVDEENHRALLITEKLIDCLRYHERPDDITWEYCTLRKWMNGEFLREAFTAEEASWILSVWNENEDNSRLGTRGGNATRDRVFALSIGEAKECFENGMDIRAAPTTYAVKKGSYEDDEYKTTDNETTVWWWLRSPGFDSSNAASVFTDGVVFEFGSNVNNSSVSVRPALWLHL